MNIAKKQDFEFSKDDLSSPAQKDFFDYWHLIKADKQMPSRADFDPMKIPGALPYLVMEEVHNNPLRFKIRLIGSKCKVSPSYLGRFIHEIPEMSRAAQMLTIGAEKKKPYFYFNKITLDHDLIRVYSSLVLPFSEDGEDINIFMACHSLID